MEQALYWIWLANGVGPGFAQAGALLDEYANAQNVWDAMQAGDSLPMLPRTAVKRLAQTPIESSEPLLQTLWRGGIEVLTPQDADYPQRLRWLPDLPLALYATGNTHCLNGERYVGVVGTRRPTAYGVRACHEISAELARNDVVIVSGLADGLDSEGHKAAVEVGTHTIGYLGTPIDETYPAANRALRRSIEEQGGAVVSEFAPGAHYDRKAGFLLRNRLIAGQGEALCVAEARIRSGTTNTIGHAQRYGRPVFAVPGSIFSPVSEGTNDLLQSGQAKMLISARDVLMQLGLAPDANSTQDGQETGTNAKAASEASQLTLEAQVVLAALGPEPRSLAELCEASGLPAQKLLAALTELELEGAAVGCPGRRYRIGD